VRNERDRIETRTRSSSVGWWNGRVTSLAVPDIRLRESLAATVADFGDVAAMHGSGYWHLGEGPLDTSASGVATMVETLRGYADPSRELGERWVHCDYLWITDGEPEEVIGFIAIRHVLNDFLLDQGGHVGYSIRPARRGQGHATRALALAVGRAAELGIARVLVTCDDDNEASRRTILRNGGVLEDVRQRKERYWIDTAARQTDR
jgi:predicted acetyltransferase